MSAPSSLDALHDRLEQLAGHDAFAGVVAVQRGPERLFEGAYGPASRRWPVPIELSSRFDTASITKLFTSVAVLQQVDAGTLDLDASITRVVDLAGSTISPDVTLRHLLSHTSGIADDADEEAGEDYAALWVDKPCYAVTRTADFLPQFVDKPPSFPPGQGCRYCNVGYVLAGLAVEAVTGQTYRDYVVANVFGPAGMTRSGFFDRRDAVPDVAEGWDPVRDEAGTITGWQANIFSYPPIGSPDGGAHVTAGDLLAFAAALRAGRLLSAAGTQAFVTPQALHHVGQDGVAIHHALGPELQVLPDGTVRSWSKDGINAGASGILRHYPAQGVDVVVLASMADGAWAPVGLVDGFVSGLPAHG
ncbi:serine hydrolase [Cellulomonas sp. KRMCY2]|uniref:serine hydrolase domain-containing protein n=1 Tax=Cellulomonas sp. KRMCY2 TaxID=1304865 RepID=UPI00045E9AFB|nr:serine hydrolase domain-containing protein [Cellulomonas sp. KRMCY2]